MNQKIGPPFEQTMVKMTLIEINGIDTSGRFVEALENNFSLVILAIRLRVTIATVQYYD